MCMPGSIYVVIDYRQHNRARPNMRKNPGCLGCHRPASRRGQPKTRALNRSRTCRDTIPSDIEFSADACDRERPDPNNARDWCPCDDKKRQMSSAQTPKHEFPLRWNRFFVLVAVSLSSLGRRASNRAPGHSGFHAASVSSHLDSS